MPLRSIYHTGPVTALHCHGNFLISGVGSRVNVYSITNTELQQSIEVLPATVIHGIKSVFGDKHSRQLSIYGQKCLRLMDYDVGKVTAHVCGEPLEFSDWIWDVTCVQNNAVTRQLCLALGHNVIITYDVDKQHITSRVHCHEKCILYCAKFLTSQPDCVILAAGTVFNQVVIWSAQSTVNSSGRVEPFHRLTGHQGVIFSVDYDPKSQMICSVSDDRSVRLYRIQFRRGAGLASLEDWEGVESSLLHVLYGHSARVWDVRLLPTCFISIGEDCTCCIWSYEGNVIQRFKGHKGKSIWSMCVDKGENYVVTGGGDNSIRLWKLQQQQLQNEESNTRSLDLKLDREDFPRTAMLYGHDRILVITNMGKLVLYNQSTDQLVRLMSDDAFMSYTVMGVSPSGRCIAIGNVHGTLRILYTPEKHLIESRQFTMTDVKVCEGKILSLVWLKEGNLLTTSPHGIINIWNIDYHDNMLYLVMTFTFELTPSRQRFVSTATLAREGSHIICGDRTGSVFLYTLDEVKKQGELIQAFPKIHGKAGVTYVCCHDNHVYTAGRDGIYRMFVWNAACQLDLLHSNRVCKGFEWIERLMFVDDGDIQIQGFYTNLFVVWSVRQNQKFLEIECGGGHRAWDYCCLGNEATFVYVKTREVKVTNMKIRSNQVIVKKCLHGRELCDAKHISSGTDARGNPVDALVTCSEDTSVCLSFLYHEKGTARLDVRHSLSGHISTIRCLCVCSSSQDSNWAHVAEKEAPGTECKSIFNQARNQLHAAENENPKMNRKLIFSAGGRAQLKVWRVEVKFEETKDIHVSENVSTSTEISDLKPEFQNNNLDTSMSQIHIHSEMIEHNFTDVSKDVMDDKPIFCDNKTNRNLDHGCTFRYESIAAIHLTEISRKCRKPWKQPVNNSDPETRILDLSVVTPQELGDLGTRSLHFVSAACSDGLLRFLAFDEVSRVISMLGSSSYHDHCVLKTCHVILQNSQVIKSCDTDHVTEINQWPVRIVVLSAATDGKVAFWDITEMCKAFSSTRLITRSPNVSGNTSLQIAEGKLDIAPFFATELHQSGINSLFCGKYSDDDHILVTGGDDNAFKVNIITMDTTDVTVNVKVIASGDDVNAHSAQITGVWFVHPQLIVTASIDQRISIWQMEVDNSQILLKRSECMFTSVSDVSNIDVWNDRELQYLLISGNGMEVLEFETLRKSVNQSEVKNETKLQTSTETGNQSNIVTTETILQTSTETGNQV